MVSRWAWKVHREGNGPILNDAWSFSGTSSQKYQTFRQVKIICQVYSWLNPEISAYFHRWHLDKKDENDEIFPPNYGRVVGLHRLHGWNSGLADGPCWSVELSLCGFAWEKTPEVIRLIYFDMSSCVNLYYYISLYVYRIYHVVIWYHHISVNIFIFSLLFISSSLYIYIYRYMSYVGSNGVIPSWVSLQGLQWSFACFGTNLLIRMVEK